MQVSTDKLMKDLRAVVVDTEDLVKATAGQAGERIEESLRNARTRVQAASHDVQAAARAHPWTAVGIVTAIGFVVGIILLGRKRGPRGPWLRLVSARR
jgi:ElaB/YqjD/DUF883 family membrane-anchored ribosome-binding protein